MVVERPYAGFLGEAMGRKVVPIGEWVE